MAVWNRCLRAAAVGGVVWAGVALIWTMAASSPGWDRGSNCTPSQLCFGYSILAVPLLLFVGALAMWPSLYWAGVRRAVLPALLGPLVLFLFFQAGLSINLPAVIWSGVSTVLSYALAALVTAPQVPTPWRVSAAVVIVLPALWLLRMVV